MVHHLLDARRESPAQSEGGSKPLGEGAEIGAEEGVDGVGEGVVWAEPAVGYGGQGLARAQGVEHVGPWPWHGLAFGFGWGVCMYRVFIDCEIRRLNFV